MSFINLFRLFSRLSNLEKQFKMFDDQLKSLRTDLDGVKADFVTITGGIGTLNQTVTDLETKLATAGLSADQQAALDAVVTEAGDLKTTADTIAANFAPKAS